MILKLKNSLSFINSKEFSSLLIPCLPHFIFLLLKLLLDVGSSCSVFHFPTSFIFSFILLFCILRISSYLTPSWLFSLHLCRLLLICCCCCSATKSCLILCNPWTAAYQAFLSFTISQSLLRFMSTELVMLSIHLFLCCTLLLLSSIFPSIRAFLNESALYIRWPKYWSFSINPSNE